MLRTSWSCWCRACVVAGSLAACGGGAAERPDPTTLKNSAVANAPAPAHADAATVLLLGTSITAGYGLDPAESWAALLQAKVDSAGLPFHVVNAGVSGETSAGALRRSEWLFAQGPIRVLVIETGANDGLRGQPVDSLRANLEAIVARAEALSPKPVIILAGMEALPNLGRQYAQRFRAVYPELATAHGIGYLPFLLDGVAGVDTLNQADGIHPNALGSRRVAENVWRMLAPILSKGGSAP